MARRKRAAKTADAGAIDQLLDQLDEGLANGDQSAVEAALPHVLAEQETAAQVLTQRLIDGRVRVPIFAFEMLAGLSGPLAVDYFERIASASEADDLAASGRSDDSAGRSAARTSSASLSSTRSATARAPFGA
ncbi:MAG: hypothetical protein U0232_02065 [Thermomicrobiales bacterium]